ncbi:MAG: (d)CMP kinase [bacterium]
MNYKNSELVITIDGPAGAGKSTVAKIIAQKLGYSYINTGDLYRYVTFCALKENLDVKKAEVMDSLSRNIVNQLTKKHQHKQNLALFFEQNNVITEKIHSPEIDKNVSFVARHESVRRNLIPLQRLLAENRPIVMEGRDIGTVILPNADLKFFLMADEKTRTTRRYKELLKKGYHVTLKEVKSEIIKRDNLDSKREFSPLTVPKDAIIVDTSDKNINAVIEIVLRVIRGRENM